MISHAHFLFAHVFIFVTGNGKNDSLDLTLLSPNHSLGGWTDEFGHKCQIVLGFFAATAVTAR